MTRRVPQASCLREAAQAGRMIEAARIPRHSHVAQHRPHSPQIAGTAVTVLQAA